MLISIIVPVYKVEKYIHRVINNVLNQSFQDFELILIDDGSPDKSGKICDEYAKKDSRIVVKHIKNGGVSNARNLGIEISRGEYLQFLDSDDGIEEHMLDTLYKTITNLNKDFVICGYNIADEITGENLGKVQGIAGNYSKEEFMKVISSYIRKDIFNSPWNKLYKSKIIKDNHINFDTNMDLGEDLIFNLQYLEKCTGVAGIEDCLYNYSVKSGDSLSTKFRRGFADNQFFLIDTIREVMKKYQVFQGENRDYINRQYISTVIGTMNMIYHKDSNFTKDEAVKEIQHITRNKNYREAAKEEFSSLTSQDKFIYNTSEKGSYGKIYMAFKMKNFLRNNSGTVFQVLKKYVRKQGKNNKV